ncbi:MAG: ComEC/Rec2 family competence protein [Spirochaetaceae bacterium]|jgi:competence protein ComEC|nr:ComEC/Rec2 family competence protein [Spirochaetaceae bacterium]
MVKKYPPPVLFAILGAAGSYYVPVFLIKAGLPWLFPALILGALLFAVLGFFRALGTLYSTASFTALLGEEAARLPRRARLLALFLAAGLVLGFSARLAAREHSAPGLETGRITGIAGVLVEDPRLSTGGRGQGRLSLSASRGANGTVTSARGTALVFFPEESFTRLRDFGRGAELYLEGNFLPPRAETRGAASPVFSAASVHVVKAPPSAERARTAVRLSIAEFYGKKTWGGLALALLLGIRDNLDSGLAASYRNAGLAHILALSGMHLGIVAAVLAFLLKKPLGVKGSALVSSIGVVLYVYLAAVQPSLARAAVMYLAGAAAVIFVLPVRLPLILGLTFIIQIALWPGAGDSVSFVLSYLALAGILLPGRALTGILRGKAPAFLAAPLAASTGAFLAGMGATAFYFGIVQPMGIVASLVVSPLTTVFMIAAMAAPLAAPLAPLARVLDGFLAALYRFMEVFVRLAGSVRPIRAAGFPALAVSLVLIILVFRCFRAARDGERCAPFAAS